MSLIIAPSGNARRKVRGDCFAMLKTDLLERSMKLLFGKTSRTRRSLFAPLVPTTMIAGYFEAMLRSSRFFFINSNLFPLFVVIKV